MTKSGSLALPLFPKETEDQHGHRASGHRLGRRDTPGSGPRSPQAPGELSATSSRLVLPLFWKSRAGKYGMIQGHCQETLTLQGDSAALLSSGAGQLDPSNPSTPPPVPHCCWGEDFPTPTSPIDPTTGGWARGAGSRVSLCSSSVQPHKYPALHGLTHILIHVHTSTQRNTPGLDTGGHRYPQTRRYASKGTSP